VVTKKVTQEDVDEVHVLYIEALKQGISGDKPLAWASAVGAYLKLREDSLSYASDDSSKELSDKLSERRMALRAKLTAVGS
jgi:hypothetical protein